MNIHNDPEVIEYLEAIELRKRPANDEHYRKFEGHTAEIFSAFGNGDVYFDPLFRYIEDSSATESRWEKEGELR